MMKKTTILMVMALAVAFVGFSLVAYGLPKNKQAPAPASAPAVSGSQQQPAAATARPDMVVWDDEALLNTNAETDPIPARYLGASRVGQATVPFVDVRVGTEGHPGGNNHMRDQLAVNPNTGVVHMAYRVWIGFTQADSFAQNLPYYYNSYDCGGSNAVDQGALGIRMSSTFTFVPPDARLREIGALGGVLNFRSAGQQPIVWGDRYIQRTDLGPPARWSRRGSGIIRDGAECTGLFSMTGADTSVNVDPNKLQTYMHAVTDSVWVWTYRDILDPNIVWFNYTKDAGATWEPMIQNPGGLSSPWFNDVHIASNGGNTFYIVTATDPAVPTTFGATERPCYVKGTINPVTHTITFSAITDPVGNFLLPGFLTDMFSVHGIMVGDTLHMMWTDWNNYKGAGFPGPGGHVWHIAVLPDGTPQGPHLISNINIDGRLPDRSFTLFGFAIGAWGAATRLVYDTPDKVLYALWSQPPDDGNFGWADYRTAGSTLAVFDIFCSASPNNGRVWDDPVNISDTQNPGCGASNGSNPCIHEDHFSAYPEAVNDTIWILALVKASPGYRIEAQRSGIAPDPGYNDLLQNKIRLYKAPARAPIPSVRANMAPAVGDTTKLHLVQIQPRGSYTVNMSLLNIGLVSWFLDSLKVGAGLNDTDLATSQPLLLTSTTHTNGTLVPSGGSHDFDLVFNAAGVGSVNAGIRQGFLTAYVRTTDPSVPLAERERSVILNVQAYVLPSFCVNRQIEIHSGNNRTDAGTQGSIADQAGTDGLFYPFDPNGESNRFYDGGVWIAWDKGADDRAACASGPRKVTRQIFNDIFLRCIADGELDSVSGGGYYNLFLRSIATDLEDSTIIWQNLWEQSTHPDSSDWLLQNVKVINAGEANIDSIAMGVCYDIDVLSDISSPAGNVGGDTTILGADGRYYPLGYIAGNALIVDTCAPNDQQYGVIIIPEADSNYAIGDTVDPRGLVVYRQVGFSYNLDCGIPEAGDTLAQRYSWHLTGVHSTNNRIRQPDRSDDTLTGFFPSDGDSCLDGRLWRDDMGYMGIAKKVYDFPVNIGAREVVGRYGLSGLAASVDTFFKGSGEGYTVIHIGSVSGLSGLIANAQRAVKWFWDHAGLQAGAAPQTKLRADLEAPFNALTGADVVAELTYIFNQDDKDASNNLIPKCVADVNGDGNVSPSDLVRILFGFSNCNPPPCADPSGCPLCLTSCQ